MSSVGRDAQNQSVTMRDTLPNEGCRFQDFGHSLSQNGSRIHPTVYRRRLTEMRATISSQTRALTGEPC